MCHFRLRFSTSFGLFPVDFFELFLSVLRLRVFVTAKVNFDVARRIPAEYYRSISNYNYSAFVIRHFVLSAQFLWVSSSSAFPCRRRLPRLLFYVSVIATSLGYGCTLRRQTGSPGS